MTYSSSLTWLAKCAVTAILLLLACAFATSRLGSASLQMPSVTTRDGSLNTLNRYVTEQPPDIVLVGSSLAFRLREEYFETPKIRNLALAGGSPVTGLAIVAGQPRVPKIVLVETNVLSRPVDDSLIAKFAHSDAAEPGMLRPVRAAIAAFEKWNHAPPTPAQAAANKAFLLRQPPGDFDNRVYIDRVVREQNVDDPTGEGVTRANIKRMQELIPLLEQKGTRVLLFDVPFPPAVRDTKRVHVTNDMLRAAFPDRARWLALSVPDTELRWPDGGHLDERSSIIVARAIVQAVAASAKAK